LIIAVDADPALFSAKKQEPTSRTARQRAPNIIVWN
jgi:hypothetical protein